VPSAAASYSERSVLGRPMSNRSWIHIWSRRGHPRRIASLLAGLVTADLGHLLEGCVDNPLRLGDHAPRHGVPR
jgi:hypothetical protein